MAVKVFLSTDAAAPVLTGVAGSLIAVLDACLVNGYGAKAAAGWTKPYAGANTAAYRMATAGNTGFYLDVNDNGPGAHGGREARLRGYETMSAVATGTGGFPTAAQLAAGVICRKSVAASATARNWAIVADDSVFYMFLDTGDYAAPTHAFSIAFGDFYSYKAADAYRCQISGREAEAQTSGSYENLPLLQQFTLSQTNSTMIASYVARSWTGIGGSVGFTKHSSVLLGYPGASSTTTGSSACSVAYPNGPDASLLMAPFFIGHSACVRGYMKGLWAALQTEPVGHLDTFAGSGAMAGKTFLAIAVQGYAAGMLYAETSSTWS